jgi:soluble lytic murein transglycosylase
MSAATATANVSVTRAQVEDLTGGGDHFRATITAAAFAGKSRVDRWLSERPGLPQDEFIDDIPFPETQNYVRRILGTAEDYRRLYGPRQKPAGPPKAAPPRTAQPGAAAPKVMPSM